MNVFENCLFESGEREFDLLPLRLLLLPLSLNKNGFSNIVGFSVYIINTIIHGCLEIWNFSSRVQFDIALNPRREIPYLGALMYYCLCSKQLLFSRTVFSYKILTQIYQSYLPKGSSLFSLVGLIENQPENFIMMHELFTKYPSFMWMRHFKNNRTMIK